MSPQSPANEDDYDQEELALMAAAEQRTQARKAEAYQVQ